MTLHFEFYGHGHPLLILHGLFGSLENWRTLSKVFSQSYQVFVLDQRNHGRSPHRDVFNYRVMAEDLKGFLQQQGLPSTHLLGHSMGGKTAMQFALTYPEDVDKLIVVDIAPKAYPPGHDDIFAALFSLTVKFSAAVRRLMLPLLNISQTLPCGSFYSKTWNEKQPAVSAGASI